MTLEALASLSSQIASPNLIVTYPLCLLLDRVPAQHRLVIFAYKLAIDGSSRTPADSEIQSVTQISIGICINVFWGEAMTSILRVWTALRLWRIKYSPLAVTWRSSSNNCLLHNSSAYSPFQCLDTISHTSTMFWFYMQICCALKLGSCTLWHCPFMLIRWGIRTTTVAVLRILWEMGWFARSF